MKRDTFLVLALVVCSGCGSGQSPQESQEQVQAIATNHGYGYEFDYESATTGIKIRNDKFAPLPIATIDTYFTEVESCIGASVRGPLIIWTNNPQDFAGIGEFARGKTYMDTGTVVLDDALQTDAYGSRLLSKHEFIHWVLWESGINRNGDDHKNHTAPQFSNCD